jgi:hypothetical protein
MTFLLLASERTKITADSSAALRNDNKTDNGRDKDNSRSPSGMTTRKTKATATRKTKTTATRKTKTTAKDQM